MTISSGECKVHGPTLKHSPTCSLFISPFCIAQLHGAMYLPALVVWQLDSPQVTPVSCQTPQ